MPLVDHVNLSEDKRSVKAEYVKDQVPLENSYRRPGQVCVALC